MLPARTSRSCPGARDFAPGDVRFTFLVVDGQGRVVTRPDRRVWLADGLKSKPFAQRDGQLGADRRRPRPSRASRPTIFVAHLELDEPGTYWLLAEPVGGRRSRRSATSSSRSRRRRRPSAPMRSPRRRRRSPTRRSKQLTTSKVPDRELYGSSVADALAAKSPFVVVFATPKFCTSRTCGPVVDVVSDVRRKHAGDGHPLHPRRDLQGQRPGEGREPLGERVEAAVGAVGLPRRRRRADQGALRGHGLGARAGRGRRRRSASARVSGVFRPGKSRRWADEDVEPGARSRSAASPGAARLLRVLREVGVVGEQPATREGAQAFRLALEELGTTFVKLGQLLSSRPDLLPDVYIDELEQLVDDVPPVPVRGARAGSSTRRSAPSVFARLDEQPLASASIAQIHSGAAAHRPRGRRQGPAARDRGAGRARSRPAALADVVRRGPLADGAAAPAHGAGGRARDAPARRAGLRRGGARPELIAQLVAEHERAASCRR